MAKRSARKRRANSLRRRQRQRKKKQVARDRQFDVSNPDLFEPYASYELHEAPKLEEYQVVSAFRRRGRFQVSRRMQRVGNIRSMWHGTSADVAVDSISRQGLRIRKGMPGLRPTWGGLFGHGVYLAPHIEKAVSHMKPWFDGYAALLRCWVAAGRQMNVNEAGCKRAEVEQGGYDSVMAYANTKINGVWAGALRYAECVVYDPSQVSVADIFIYYRTKR